MQAQLQQRHYSAALYMRLSKDDENVGESESITTQRKMLKAYAEEHSFRIYDEYVDDGISGTTFERPAFNRMIRDIENNYINMVITKDLSRLGRDYITTGKYTEIYFPSKRVRYIAINDGYDSDSPYTDIAPFKNVVNEMYARDTSQKIRSAFITKMKNGEFVGPFAPYGYKRHPANKGKLIIDEQVTDIVKDIFQRASAGVPPKEIAKYLNDMSIPTPYEYRCSQNPNLSIDRYATSRKWTSSSIIKIINNVVYLGHMAQGKTTKVSFKSDIVISKPKEDWYFVKNTHPPTVTQETFDIAKRKSCLRKCEKKGEFFNIFSGIAKCADCGRNMSAVGSRKRGAQANLACSGYKHQTSSACSNHFIDYDVLCNIVREALTEMMTLTQEKEERILTAVDKHFQSQKPDNRNEAREKELVKREREVDSLIEKIYEDHIKGVLSDERMQRMLKKYENESKSIAHQLEAVKNNESPDKEELNLLQAAKKVLHEFTEVKDLTNDIVCRLIEHIEIGQGRFEKTAQGKTKIQTVTIFFRFRQTPYMKTYRL